MVDDNLSPASTAAPQKPAAFNPARLRFEWRLYVVYFAFAVIFLIFSVTQAGNGFLTVTNLLNIVSETANISVVAVAVVFVIGAAEIDLSVGAVAGLASVTAALAVNHWGIAVGVACGLATGLLIGLVNGALVTRVGIPSFLVTLGMMGVASGIGMWITSAAPVPIQSDLFNGIFGSGFMGPIPSLVIWTGIALVVGHITLRHTSHGRRILATGGNEIAARFSGINTRNVKHVALAVSGLVAGLSGLLYAGRYESGRYQWGTGDELSVIAAVILGGTSLFGGQASVMGAIVGALLISLINNGLILMGLEISQVQVARGALIILAVALARRRLTA
ncbi:MAG TPA: ABC transporter permease [Candidatus Dormibacteraeota bacterium]